MLFLSLEKERVDGVKSRIIPLMLNESNLNIHFSGYQPLVDFPRFYQETRSVFPLPSSLLLLPPLLFPFQQV